MNALTFLAAIVCAAITTAAALMEESYEFPRPAKWFVIVIAGGCTALLVWLGVRS